VKILCRGFIALILL